MATGKKSNGKKPDELVKTPLMYVGPTIPQIGCVQNVVYSDIPELAKKAITEKPVIKVLFVLLESYPEAEKDIREQSGYYWAAYKAALQYQAELKNGGN